MSIVAKSDICSSLVTMARHCTQVWALLRSNVAGQHVCSWPQMAEVEEAGLHYFALGGSTGATQETPGGKVRLKVHDFNIVLQSRC